MSNITELNEILFDRLKAINNDDLSDEQLSLRRYLRMLPLLWQHRKQGIG